MGQIDFAYSHPVLITPFFRTGLDFKNIITIQSHPVLSKNPSRVKK
jgi:hypothetical protein